MTLEEITINTSPVYRQDPLLASNLQSVIRNKAELLTRDPDEDRVLAEKLFDHGMAAVSRVMERQHLFFSEGEPVAPENLGFVWNISWGEFNATIRRGDEFVFIRLKPRYEFDVSSVSSNDVHRWVEKGLMVVEGPAPEGTLTMVPVSENEP